MNLLTKFHHRFPKVPHLGSDLAVKMHILNPYFILSIHIDCIFYSVPFCFISFRSIPFHSSSFPLRQILPNIAQSPEIGSFTALVQSSAFINHATWMKRLRILKLAIFTMNSEFDFYNTNITCFVRFCAIKTYTTAYVGHYKTVCSTQVSRITGNTTLLISNYTF